MATATFLFVPPPLPTWGVMKSTSGTIQGLEGEFITRLHRNLLVLEDPLVAVEFDEQFSFSELDNQILGLNWLELPKSR